MVNEVQQAQERLGQSLARAHVAEDRALAGEVRERGEHFVQLLTGLMRLSHIHASDNRAFDRPVSELVALLEALYGLLGAVHLVSVEDQVYINDIRIRSTDRNAGVGELAAELKRHNVGAVTFHAPLSEAQVRAFLSALSAPPGEPHRRNALTRALRAQGIDQLDLFGLFRFRKADEADFRKFDAREYLSRALPAVAEAYQSLAAGRLPNPLTLRRLVAELLRQDLDTEGLWEELAGADPHSQHAFRTAHLSLVVGQALGLSPATLQDLGLAALYHDMGYAEVAFISLDQHAGAGARLLMRQRGFNEAKIRRILAVLQHNRDFNDPRGRPGLFARIVRIAEDYDNMVRRRGAPPAAAVALLVPFAGTRYDPALLQCFVNRMGRIPPGTLVELEDGRVVRTVSLVRDPSSFERPLARVVRDARGAAPAPPPLIDLARDGRPRRVLARLG